MKGWGVRFVCTQSQSAVQSHTHAKHNDQTGACVCTITIPGSAGVTFVMAGRPSAPVESESAPALGDGAPIHPRCGDGSIYAAALGRGVERVPGHEGVHCALGRERTLKIQPV